MGDATIIPEGDKTQARILHKGQARRRKHTETYQRPLLEFVGNNNAQVLLAVRC